MPFLINKEDKSAIDIILDFIAEALSHTSTLDQTGNSKNQKKFISLFNLERVIEILESVPVQKNFIKDAIANYGQMVNEQYGYLMSVSLSQPNNE